MDAAQQPPDAHTTPVPRRWRLPVWTLFAGALAVGIAVGLVVPWLMSPKVVAQLRPTTEAPLAIPMEGVPFDPATVVQYDDTDLARAWSAHKENGAECLFVIVGDAWPDSACAPGGLDPTVSIILEDNADAAASLGLPLGSLVRLVLRDGVVEVWIAAPDEPFRQ